MAEVQLAEHRLEHPGVRLCRVGEVGVSTGWMRPPFLPCVRAANGHATTEKHQQRGSQIRFPQSLNIQCNSTVLWLYTPWNPILLRQSTRAFTTWHTVWCYFWAVCSTNFDQATELLQCAVKQQTKSVELCHWDGFSKEGIKSPLVRAATADWPIFFSLRAWASTLNYLC